MQVPQNFINKIVVVYNTKCNLGATRHVNYCEFTTLFPKQAIELLGELTKRIIIAISW